MARPLVRAVFALLVVATIAAFFVTQQLKSEDALVLRFAAQPKQFSPNGDGTRDRSKIGFDLSRPATVSFYVLDGGGKGIRRVVDARGLAGDAKHRFVWDGRDDEGVPVPDGLYRMRVVQRSEGRVINSTKRVSVDRRPPEVALLETAPGVIAPREPGQKVEVVVRYRGPSNSAPEFRVFRTDVAGRPLVVRRFRGNDDRRGIWHGEVATGPEQTEPAPDGDYAFTVTVRDKAGNPTVAPAEIPRPATSWQGLNAVDDDLDGFADTLPDGRSVGLTGRPFRSGGLPPRFASEVGPLLRYLDRERLAYDITTDVSLARGEGPALGNAPGVALAGSALWLPEPLMRRLRDEVQDGLRVANFGADALRRTVRLRDDRLTDPSGRRRVDAFGEGSGMLRTSSAPLTVFEDGLGLFEDLDPFIGDFTVFEESSGLPTESRPVAAGGRDPRRPAFVAYALGGGLVIRSGTPQWARELEEERLGAEVPAVTRRIWRLLGQGVR